LTVIYGFGSAGSSAVLVVGEAGGSGEGRSLLRLEANAAAVLWADAEILAVPAAAAEAPFYLLSTFYSDLEAALLAYTRCELKPDGTGQGETQQQRMDWLMAYIESGHRLSPLSDSPLASLFEIETSVLASPVEEEEQEEEEEEEREVPPYDVQLVRGGAELRFVVLLCGVERAADLDLDLEPDTFKLEAKRADGGKPWRLALRLACHVDDGTMAVKFDKGTGILCATVAVRP